MEGVYFIMNNKFNSVDYKRSRTMYMAQCTFEYFVTILVADAFLAKLLSNIGISDGAIGIISSIITLAFLFQLLSLFLVSKIKNVKRTVIISHTLCQLFFASLYLIPFMPTSTEVKTLIVVVCVLFAYIFNYLVASILFKWANSFVDPKKRGIFSATKEMISLFTGIFFTLAAGAIIDKYEALGNIKGGFLFISISILVLTVLNFISLLYIKNENMEQERVKHSFKDIYANTLGNKNFKNIVTMTVLWDIARYISVGFLGIYKTKELMLSVAAVQVINMIGNVARLVLSLPFGRYSDKHSYAKGIELGYIIAAAGFAFNVFATPDTWWCMVIYTVLYNVSLAGSNQNAFNITYSYVKSDYIVHAVAIKNSIGGIFGFCASLVGSKILNYIQGNGNIIFGIPMYGQQFLCLITFVIIVVNVLFIKFVIEKQKVMVQ